VRADATRKSSNPAIRTNEGKIPVKENIQWRACWEHELEPADHAELAEFFRNTYGDLGEWNATCLPGNRSSTGSIIDRNGLAL
jgi:Nodulation protein A (NodA)